jgi:hypothetical protein
MVASSAQIIISDNFRNNDDTLLVTVKTSLEAGSSTNFWAGFSLRCVYGRTCSEISMSFIYLKDKSVQERESKAKIVGILVAISQLIHCSGRTYFIS